MAPRVFPGFGAEKQAAVWGLLWGGLPSAGESPASDLQRFEARLSPGESFPLDEWVFLLIRGYFEQRGFWAA